MSTARNVSFVLRLLARDMLTRLSHRTDQRKLGFAMRVKRSTVDDVKARLALHKTKSTPAGIVKPSKQTYDYEQRVKQMEQAQRAEEEARRLERKAKRQKTNGGEDQASSASDDATATAQAAIEAKPADDGNADAGGDGGLDIAALMGFGSFGGSRKQ